MRQNRFVPLFLALFTVTPAFGQAVAAGDPGTSPSAAADSMADDATTAVTTQPAATIQHLRPADQRGNNVFEPPKQDDVAYNGFRLSWGASFAQQFQMLEHENTAAPRPLTDATGAEYDANQLMDIGAGFNLASANLVLNAQLAPGIRVALETYLSSRHHQETWVKDGYLLVDASPIDVPVLNTLMEYVTLKAGMFELNYGDAHFRRTDNGNAIHNPFVGNLIMDAFTTEIGTEVYVRSNGLLAMVGVTGGVNKGDVTNPDARGPAFLGKIGFDRQLTPDLRVRLTGSAYTVDRTPGVTLYGGDRAGSRYYLVLENTKATTNNNFTSGVINPGFRNEMTAFQVNPFVKLGGLEIFGVLEQAEGRASSEAETRRWEQFAADAVYHFLPREQLYVGARYNTASGELAGLANEVSIDRTALAAGWFITPSILLKGEYVNQQYNDFPAADIRNGGRFNGLVIEGVVSF
jgi:hypothetical protein